MRDSYQVLLVEDDPWLAELYKDALETDQGCYVFWAPTAERALEHLDKNPDINLILLDMFLPEHNGIEFLHEVASYTDINTKPVVVLSSVYRHDFKMSIERWRNYGVVEYLYKPATKPEQLLSTVKKLVAEGVLTP